YIDSIANQGGNQARQISAEYMIPMPVWKSSYRLIWDQTAEPTLEGWAIVDNTTGEDWDNVQLSLVSGRPISFISRLYEPRYITRRQAELREDRAVGRVVYEGAMEGKPMVQNMAQRAAVAPPAQRQGAAGEMLMNAPARMKKEMGMKDERDENERRLDALS